MLIKEINDLRRELKIARVQVHDLEAAIGTNRSNKGLDANNAMRRAHTSATSKWILCSVSIVLSFIFLLVSVASGTSATFSISRQNMEGEAPRIIEMQKAEIRRLRNQVG